jgi:hypothetical protein
MQRLYYVAKDEPRNHQDTLRNRKDFVSFVDEHDKRRGTNFLATFPEMEEFYRMCKELK